MNPIFEFIEQQKLIKKESTVVVGLSGGPDSVFLLHLLANMRDAGKFKTLIAAHLDHEWRTDSHKDVAFCAQMAKKHNVLLAVRKISELAISSKFNGSQEEAGRNARRFFFENVKKEYDADLIALGHHAQDQQETFFIRLLRGATLTGLAGMQPKRGCYIRPLLQTNKTDILDFLHKNKIPYLTDPSNQSDKFLRNRIRNNLFPQLHKTDSRFATKLSQTMDDLGQTEQLLQQLTLQAFETVSTKTATGFSLDTEKLFSLHPILYKRVLMHWLCVQQVPFPASKGFFEEMVRFLQGPVGGNHQLHKTWKIVKKQKSASICSNRFAN